MTMLYPHDRILRHDLTVDCALAPAGNEPRLPYGDGMLETRTIFISRCVLLFIVSLNIGTRVVDNDQTLTALTTRRHRRATDASC